MKQDLMLIWPLGDVFLKPCSKLAVLLIGLCAAWTVFCSVPASAHPHVFVAAESEILYASDGSITGIRHRWSFDEGYSAFAVQGLDKNNDGKITPDELVELAKVNVESLHEFGFFTVAKANGKKQDFAAPVDYSLNFDKSTLTLTFTIPLKSPVAAPKTFGLEVFDESYFVSFGWAKAEDAVKLIAPPKGCMLTITRPKAEDSKSMQNLTEDFFSSSQARNIGLQLANKAIVACP